MRSNEFGGFWQPVTRVRAGPVAIPGTADVAVQAVTVFRTRSAAAAPRELKESPARWEARDPRAITAGWPVGSSSTAKGRKRFTGAARLQESRPRMSDEHLFVAGRLCDA